MPLALLVLTASLLWSQPAASPPAPSFDAVAATNAYLATVPADKKARSDAYFEGGYWLILWDFLYGAAIAVLLLSTRLSSRMRSLAERLTPLPTPAHLRVLAPVSPRDLRDHLPADRLRRIHPRAPIRPGHANLRYPGWETN